MSLWFSGSEQNESGKRENKSGKGKAKKAYAKINDSHGTSDKGLPDGGCGGLRTA